MTGFARKERTISKQQITVEIRSVNHKHLDIHFRLPDTLRQHEALLRDPIISRLQRGRIDVSIHIETTVDSESNTQIDIATLKRLKQQLQQIQTVIPNALNPSTLEILQAPGMICNQAHNPQELAHACQTVILEAVSALVQTREQEGKQICQMLVNRIAKCRQLTCALSEGIGEINAMAMANFKKRLAQFDTHVDEQRIAQETAILLTKADVSEELDRLITHYDEIDNLLSNPTTSIGRRLDFLMQELNREANTLASKSNHMSLTNTAVELKVLIDQMREQIQNIQ